MNALAGGSKLTKNALTLASSPACGGAFLQKKLSLLSII
jgi:hypothetical protein